MKKVLLIILALAVLSFTAITFSGCSSNNDNEQEKKAVCFLIANTANSQGLNMNSPLVQDTVYNTIKNYGYIAVISVDGNPETIFANSFDIDERYKNASKDKLEMDARSKSTNLIQSMQSIKANDQEVDYLSALTLGIRTFDSLEGYSSKTIIVLGTGLSTAGVLDFRNNLLSAEPKAVVDLLEEREAIPNFSGITVVWQQLGDVASPQQSLTLSQKNNLNEIYSELVSRGGGDYISNDFIANPVDTNNEYPSVSIVELPADSPIEFDIEETSQFQTPVTLTEEQVCFIPDKADYLNPEEAENTIKPIADYMLNHDAEITMLLIGCIAGDSNSDFGYTLSQNRAEKVKSTLIDFGVPANRLIVKGMGVSDPWHIENAGYEGKLASQNRKVVLIDSSTEIAKSIMNT